MGEALRETIRPGRAHPRTSAARRACVTSGVVLTPNSSLITSPNGLALAVHDWGGDGPPVLLAHPTGFHGLVWGPTAQRLRDAGRHPYSFDFRGHGDSQRGEQIVGWDGFGADALCVAEHFCIAGDGALIAAGHSKGAAALLLAEHATPGTFRNIWAYEPITFPFDGPLPHADDFPLAVGARRRRNEWTSTEEAFTAYASKPPMNAFDVEVLHAYANGALRDRGDGVMVLKCSPDAEAEVYASGPTNDLFRRLPAINAHVVVACGELTDAIGPTQAAAIVDRLPNATLEVWAQHGHFGPQVDPARAAQSIVSVMHPGVA